MELLGYSAAFVIGLLLGSLGGGGSILALPVLIYLFRIETVLATSYSLFIVGNTAAFGGAISMARKTADLKAVVLFAMPSLLSVFLVRSILVPLLPENILTVLNLTITKDSLLIGLFIVLMLTAGSLMITGKCIHCDKEIQPNFKINYGLLVLEGIAIGTITGLIGAGGGFLVIPALVLYAGVPMRLAVGTSLLIISLNSLTGFLGDLLVDTTIDWKFLLSFTFIAMTGMYFGLWLKNLVPEKKLRTAFGYFVIAVALVMGSIEFMHH